VLGVALPAVVAVAVGGLGHGGHDREGSRGERDDDETSNPWHVLLIGTSCT
jgi:hypothetical protein